MKCVDSSLLVLHGLLHILCLVGITLDYHLKTFIKTPSLFSYFPTLVCCLPSRMGGVLVCCVGIGMCYVVHFPHNTTHALSAVALCCVI